MIRYQIPAGVEAGRTGRHIFLTTAEGGHVWIDRWMLELWKAADGRTAPDVQASNPFPEASYLQILAGLACLAEAGLLSRAEDPSTISPFKKGLTKSSTASPVSVIIVAYNSRQWLDNCLASIFCQTNAPHEIILVDNASSDGVAEWIFECHPGVHLIRLDQAIPLAAAYNLGIKAANGRYYLLINPDVVLSPDVIERMLDEFEKDQGCVCAAAKLRLLWAPAFLNGLGNLVGAFGWGTDIGLGHLDLGQFDCNHEVPSACFAAAMIPAWAIEQGGLLDEGFPMYYEDSEWCYRMRMFGFKVAAAPLAVVYHAFSSQIPSERPARLSSAKLRRITYGRLRFITRLNGLAFFYRFLMNYLFEDGLRFLFYLMGLKPKMAFSIVQGFADYLTHLPELFSIRRKLQIKRKVSDKVLYSLQKGVSVPLIRSGAPLLTWDTVVYHYLPLIVSGKTRKIPEFSSDLQPDSVEGKPLNQRSCWVRVKQFTQAQGLSSLLTQFVRWVHWQVMQP